MLSEATERIVPIVASEYVKSEEEKKKDQERKKREKKAQVKALFDETVAYYTASSEAEDRKYITYGRNLQYVKR